jgi:lipopolysaccharide export system permease protein
MQFLWKYIDDLVGKGLNTWILTELLFYASARLVPLALPLAVLLASIMTFGALGEHMELTATKSAGISLLRMMRPLVVTVFIISIFAFIFSNNLLPIMNLKFSALLYDIRHQKPSVAIKEGIFFNDIDGFSLRVENKSKNGDTLYHILVYDKSSGQGDDHVITAERGSMIQDEESMALTLYLENGKEYKDVTPKKPSEQKYEMYRTTFASWEKKFDLSKFKLTRTDENFFKDMKQMMTLDQLTHQMDTINTDRGNLIKSLGDYLHPYYGFKRDGLDSLAKKEPIAASISSFKNTEDMLRTYTKKEKISILERALSQARNVKNYTNIVQNQVHNKDLDLIAHLIEVYRKFTLSIACLVLFFVGAPLGSIIRKGGLGWPLFYAVLFFIIYHVTSIIGEKTADKMVMNTFAGMWLSTFILLPVGIFLTYKAANDSNLYNPEFYMKIFKKIIGFTTPVPASTKK